FGGIAVSRLSAAQRSSPAMGAAGRGAAEKRAGGTTHLARHQAAAREQLGALPRDDRNCVLAARGHDGSGADRKRGGEVPGLVPGRRYLWRRPAVPLGLLQQL